MSRQPSASHGPIEVVWAAPPEQVARTLTAYDEALETVKANPGRWASIRVFATGNVYTVRKGLSKKYREDRWEFKAVRDAGPPEKWTLFARYRTPEQMRNGRPT